VNEAARSSVEIVMGGGDVWCVVGDDGGLAGLSSAGGLARHAGMEPSKWYYTAYRVVCSRGQPQHPFSLLLFLHASSPPLIHSHFVDHINIIRPPPLLETALAPAPAPRPPSSSRPQYPHYHSTAAPSPSPLPSHSSALPPCAPHVVGGRNTCRVQAAAITGP
jgi:hypothetical protein